MHFIPFIRDYIEVLNNLYDSLTNDITFQKIIQETVIYLLQTIKFIGFYFFTFQWIRDLTYLPTIIPQISNSILKENFFLETPLSNFFNFLNVPSYTSNKFLIGFLNSFFLVLPFSCAQLIYIRRLLIQGNIAGIAAGLGNIFGQIFFIGSVILGFRFLIIPWFSFEPLTFLIGFFLLINIVYDMVHERVIKIIDLSNQSVVLKIFLLNFFLIWTEQSCIFQFLGNLTGSAEPTVLEIFNSTTNLNFLIDHFTYLIGLFFGLICFNIIFAIFLKNLSEFIQIKFALLKSTWVIRLNFVLLSFILAFSFSSIPFYGLDYLLTGPLGFISNDKSFKNTLFSANELKDPFGILGVFSDNLSLDTDVTSFDRGFYLKAPILQTFEDLNYSGEYASTIRQGNIPLFDQYKEKARKLREIIVKKGDNENENQQANSLKPQISKTENFQDNQNFGLDYPTYYPLDNNIYVSSNIQKRFQNNYQQNYNLVFDKIIHGTLNIAFTSDQFTVAYPEIEKKIKERYYANPIYKFLLTIDIDNFLRRQPAQFLLSSNDEKELYKKRLILGRYNDTLRFYNTIPYRQEFQYFFNGSKSFADRVYNQQFKGTLHVVRRLFSISFNSQKNENSKILKYDQPLFKFKTNQQQPLHEELEPNSFVKSPFLEGIGQNPLYIGWDESLKKIIITNRLLPKSISNFKTVNRLSDEKVSSNGTIPEKSENIIEFTTWPIKKTLLTSSKGKFLFATKNSVQELNYPNLFPLFESDDNEEKISYYEALPNNIITLASGVSDVIPPNRGGFVWPGNSYLKFSIKEIFN